MDDDKAPAPPAEAAPPPAPPVELPGVDESAIIKAVVADAPRPEDAAPVVSSDVDPRFGALRDRNGNAFDPKYHLANADGTPKLSPKGRLWGKPGVVLPGQAEEGAADAKAPAKAVRALDISAAGGDAPPAEQGSQTQEQQQGAPAPAPAAAPVAPPSALTEEERRKLALQTAEVTVQILQALGKFVAGRDGAFRKDDENGDEYRELKASYVEWYATMENLVHVSPGWVVAVNTGRYMSRCASTETGQRRIEKGSRWATSAWSKVRLMWHTWRATSAANR